MPEFRPDRIATLYFFRPLQRLLRRRSDGIPILMYHSISGSSETHRSAYFHTSTAPRVFREQLNFLARNGYKTIGLGEAARRLEAGTGTGEKLVVLTFDDGFEDFHTEAFPVLSTFGYTATVFLPTAYIGDNTIRFNGIRCLTWGRIRELRTAAIEFGSHTATHLQLTMLPAAGIRHEIQSSKEEIEDRLGSPVASFSYPYAFPEPDRAFRQRLRDMLIEAGYENGVSTMVGTADSTSDRLFLERIPVNSSDDEAFFSAKLRGGYDWLHGFQRASKQRIGLRTQTACTERTQEVIENK
jgi:peptidoglycan/xylan/chitin deacetylase (PgdA/CDA1 family)